MVSLQMHRLKLMLQTKSLPSETAEEKEETALKTKETGIIRSTEQNIPERWSTLSLIVFRFAFCYFIPFNLDKILDLAALYLGKITTLAPAVVGQYHKLWELGIGMIGRNCFGISRDITDGGFVYADSTFGWLRVGVILAFAITATLIWAAMDRRSVNYSRLHQWLRYTLRISLIAPLISYGMSKVFKFQFPETDFHILLGRVGDLSPMDLLWTFMGYSYGYNLFCGLAEVIPAVLLAFPQLTLLGALISAAVFTNVFLLNVCYDVRVKLYSLHLLLMSLVLIAPDARRLFSLLVLNSPVAPAKSVSLSKWSQLNVILLLIPIFQTGDALRQSVNHAGRMPQNMSNKCDFYGIWDVQSYTAATPSDSAAPWQKVIFDHENNVRVTTTQNANGLYCEWSADHKQVSMGPIKNFAELGACKSSGKKFVPDWYSKNTFSCSTNAAEDHMHLEGNWFGVSDISVDLKRLDKNTLPLYKQQFRWVTNID